MEPEKKSKLFGLTKTEIDGEMANPKVQITRIFSGRNSLTICWQSKIGFGQFHFTYDSNGKIICTDNENMSPAYVQATLQQWINTLQFSDELKAEQKKKDERRGTRTI